MKAYIAGPMRGHKYYNFPAFDAARDMIIGLGSEPVSPADIDRENGFDETAFPEDHDWNSWPVWNGIRLKDVILRDVKAVLDCDTIYMLNGWEKSKGATAERALAQWAGLTIYDEYIVPVEGDTPSEGMRTIILQVTDK